MLDDEIRDVLKMIHITIHWRDARNAIVPAWHFDPTCSRADVVPTSRILQVNGVLIAERSGDLFENVFRGMIAR